tara:strand:- start:7146 stop:7961 length:816 start_codon:yes stop_codon:yes gene_type:complete
MFKSIQTLINPAYVCIALLLLVTSCASTSTTSPQQISSYENELLLALETDGIESPKFSSSYEKLLTAYGNLEGMESFSKLEKLHKNVYTYHLLELGPDHEKTIGTKTSYERIKMLTSNLPSFLSNPSSIGASLNSDMSSDSEQWADTEYNFFKKSLDIYDKQDKPILADTFDGYGNKVKYDLGLNTLLSESQALVIIYKRMGDEKRTLQLLTDLNTVFTKKLGDEHKATSLVRSTLGELDERSGYASSSISEKSFEEKISAFETEANNLIF